MPETLQTIWQQVAAMAGGYLPSLVGALAILVSGWIFAKIIAAIVRGALRRTELDNRLAAWMAGGDVSTIDVEGIAGKGVFYLIMLFVLVAFLQALRLTIVTEPLNALLTQLTSFAPRLLGAAALLLVAWLLATVLRKTVSIALGAADLDRRLGGGAGLEDHHKLPLSKSLAEAVYWLVFLLFLPAILGALALEGLMAPVQGLTNKVLGFLPNLVGAAIILAIGWFVARLVQRIVTNFLAATGLDALGENVGLNAALGPRKLSGLVGLVVYVLILIPVLISSLQTLGLEAITVPATEMLSTVLDVIPALFAAGLLLAIAFFVGKLVAELISNLLAGAGFDNILQWIGLSDKATTNGRQPSAIVGSLILAAVMMFAAIEAARLLNFEALAVLILGFIVFAGQVILGVIVFGIGLYLANLAADTIRASGSSQAGILALAARVSIIVLAGAMALREMGLANDIINLAFAMLLGSVAVAVALAFGLGARQVAGQKVEGWLRSLDGPGNESQ